MVIIFSFALALSAFSSTGLARSVSMDLAFKIGSDKSDTIHANGTDFSGSQANEKTFADMNKKYVSSERNNKVFAIIFAGQEFLNGLINTSYSSNAYLIGMTQNADKNLFLMGFTSGTYNNIDEKAKDIELFGFLSGTLGNNVAFVPKNFPFFIRLEYGNADIQNRFLIRGPTKLFIRNQGKIGSIYNITFDVIS